MERRDFLKGTAIGMAAAVTANELSARAGASHQRVRVLCWSELTEPQEVYPNGISGALAESLQTQPDMSVKTAAITDPEQGLSDRALDQTDVLIWWGHLKHADVQFDRVAEVVRRVKEGQLGFIAIHSAHWSKIFKSLLDATADPGSWRHEAKVETLRVVAPFHPIAQDIEDFTIPETEMYGEPFDVPPPEKVIFFSYWATKEQFRSGMVWTVGKGRVFYFRPGHETHPIFFQPIPRKVIANAVLWCAQRT